MDTIRLNPDSVRRALPDRRTGEPDRNETERLVERVREVEPLVADADRDETS